MIRLSPREQASCELRSHKHEVLTKDSIRKSSTGLKFEGFLAQESTPQVSQKNMVIPSVALSKSILLTSCLFVGLVIFPVKAFLAPQTNLRTSVAFQETQVLSPNPVATPSPRLHTMELQANFIDRFLRVARGNLNSVVSRFEDPEKVMDQALVDMQNDLLTIRRIYSEVTASQRRLISEKNQYDAVAEDWYKRAQLALKANKEALAREALARRELAIQKSNSIQQQIDSLTGNLDKLYESMNALEGKILDAQSKKSQLAVRAKTAKSTLWVNDMLSGLSGSTSMDAFRRMEDKVAALEASAEVSAEQLSRGILSFQDGSKNTAANSPMEVEMEFRRLEASDAVDRELAKLKTKVLPATSSSSSSTSIRIPVTSVDRIEVPVL